MSVRSLVAAGVAALKSRHYAAAEAYLRDALALAPDDADAQVALGLTLAVTQREDEAVAWLQRGVASAEKRLDAWCALGEIYVARLDYQKAATALGKCLELDPDGTHPHGVRARMLIKRAERQLQKT